MTNNFAQRKFRLKKFRSEKILVTSLCLGYFGNFSVSAHRIFQSLHEYVGQWEKLFDLDAIGEKKRGFFTYLKKSHGKGSTYLLVLNENNIEVTWRIFQNNS